MNLPKAIKVLNEILTFVKPGDPPEEHDAIQLGIEGLEAIVNWRSESGEYHQLQLPSETED